MTANAYYLGAVIAVEPDKYALRATQQAYPLLDLDIDASTFGALAEEVDGISVDIFIDHLWPCCHASATCGAIPRGWHERTHNDGMSQWRNALVAVFVGGDPLNLCL